MLTKVNKQVYHNSQMHRIFIISILLIICLFDVISYKILIDPHHKRTPGTTSATITVPKHILRVKTHHDVITEEKHCFNDNCKVISIFISLSSFYLILLNPFDRANASAQEALQILNHGYVSHVPESVTWVNYTV